MQTLFLDDEDGTLYLVTHHAEDGSGVAYRTRRRLGLVSSPGTSYEVPTALLDAFAALAEEWSGAVADGRDYRGQVEGDYRAGSGF